ncbi:MAG: DUF1559 domain-containing protein [Lentisphaeria bacterium]|nr:DUF1559 domain-containing protein [Lentisphaeria bacterium]
MAGRQGQTDFGIRKRQMFVKCFTLIELLIVIAIIAILAGMLLPALNQARERARSVKCVGNLKTIGSAARSYADEYFDYIPVKGTVEDWDLGFWAYLISPYVGFKTDYSKFAWKTEWSTANWAKLFKNGTVLTCPSRRLVTTKARYRVVTDKGKTYAFNDENHGGFSYGPAFTAATISSKVPGKNWSRFKEIRGKSLSAQLLMGDNNDFGAYNIVSTASRFSMLHNPIKDNPPATSLRHNGAGNHVWADGHVTSQQKPEAMWGITKAPWVYSKTRYMYHFAIAPL